jgi:hypothetical protein
MAGATPAACSAGAGETVAASLSKQASRKLLSAILVQSEKAAGVGGSWAKADPASRNEKVVQS